MTALWAFTGPEDEQLCRHMAASLHHRGHLTPPAGRDRWAAASSTIGVRLPRSEACLGGLAASPTGDTAVAVAGRLPAGVTVETLLEEAGSGESSFLQRLGGEWVVAVATPTTLTISRDAAGARTAYWAHHGGRCVVAI